MPSVRVERLPVQTLGLGRFGFDHLQIVFRSDFGFTPAAQDDWFVIEGIREAGKDGVRLAVEGWHGGTTLSEANGGRTGAALTARIGTPESRDPREIAEGSDAIELWATLVSYAGDIHAQRFPYIPMTLPGSPLPIINSSSLVSSLLHHAGMDVEAAMPPGLRFSPGRKTLLGTSGNGTLAAGRSFTTVLAGAGDDRLKERDEPGSSDQKTLWPPISRESQTPARQDAAGAGSGSTCDEPDKVDRNGLRPRSDSRLRRVGEHAGGVRPGRR